MKTNLILVAFLLALTAVWPSEVMRTAQPSGTPAVVINELAWSGTIASATDEWIELRNNTREDIDLTGWTLSWADGEIIIHFGEAKDDTKEVRTSVIPARGFYLLERTDDTTISDIEADLIYTGSLRNPGEVLVLKDPEGNVVDTANGDGGEWPAGATSEGEVPYASMERIDPTEPDSDDNWGTNDGVIRNGKDKDGNLINGTPKAENSRKKTD
jgi:hypothetical protein